MPTTQPTTDEPDFDYLDWRAGVDSPTFAVETHDGVEYEVIVTDEPLGETPDCVHVRSETPDVTTRRVVGAGRVETQTGMHQSVIAPAAEVEAAADDGGGDA